MLLVLFCACNPNPYEDPSKQGKDSPPSDASRSITHKSSVELEQSESNPSKTSPESKAQTDVKNGQGERANVNRAAPPKIRASHPGADVTIYKQQRLNSKESLSKTDFVIQGAPKRHSVQPSVSAEEKRVSREAKVKIDAQQRQLDALKRAGLGSKPTGQN
ncbi:MAG: hypothetical protein P1V97_09560 [Planctomycetota bacterium]|nr:hypothetical protein [Planctomycetota bacterium]